MSETDFFETIRDIAGLSVVHSDFVVVSGERSGRQVYEPLTSLLRRIQVVAGVEVLFIAQFLGDTPAVRQRRPGDAQAAPAADPSEVEFGTMLFARDRAAGPGFRCVAAPVVAVDGREYGTVCCHPGSRPTRPDVDLAGVVRSAARILALALSRAATPPDECEA